MLAQNTKSTPLVNQLASEGKGIILISSELPEILGICDRIYVMSDGKIVGEMEAKRSVAGKNHEMHHDTTRGDGKMKTLTKLFKSNIREYGMLIALIAIMVFFQVENRRHPDEADQYYQPGAAKQLYYHHGPGHVIDHRFGLD